MAEKLDYADPTRGMAAMRMRILRAELKDGCMLSVPNAVESGEESMLALGNAAQPRATSTGALVSASSPVGENATSDRDFRDAALVFLSRDRSNRPLHPLLTECVYIVGAAQRSRETLYL